MASFNSKTWLVWLGAALLPALMVRNPLYLLVLLLVAAIIYAAFRGESPTARSWGILLKLGAIVWATTVLFNTLTVHYGDTVLLTVPSSVPVAGGIITLEAVVWGSCFGLGLFTIIVLFAAASTVIDHYEVVKLAPRFLYQASVIVSIAILFVPQTIVRLREIREAQLIRGHRIRGVRDLVPLLVPLITSGLEKAVQLAESMESRGFGAVGVVDNRAEGGPRQLLLRAGTVLGLVGLPLGVFVSYYFKGYRSAGLLVVLTSAALVVAVLSLQAGRVKRSRYHRERWHSGDFAVLAASLFAAGGFLYVGLFDNAALTYYPYPQVSAPAVDPVIGGLFLLLALPAVLAPRQTAEGGQKEAGQ